ncbi:hypothetical protein RCL1_000257 [Eukaryota sp. TZLM3-RCL]
MKILFKIHPQNRQVDVDVDSSDTIDTLKCLVEVTHSIPIAHQFLFLNKRELLNHEVIQQLGITENTQLDLVISQSLSEAPSNSPDHFFAFLSANPIALNQLSQENPHLAASFSRGANAFRQKFLEQRISQVSGDLVRSGHISKDSKDLERRRLIAEQRNAMMEYHPEAFVRVHMLYIDASINGHRIPLFIDTGAQQTIVSAKSGRDCAIMELLDVEFQGVAVGVGSRKILGRIHAVDIKIGNSFFNHSVTVLDSDSPLLILGLDFMLRHQVIIDLRDKLFRIGPEAASFLGENQVPPEYSLVNDPKKAESAGDAQPKNTQPSVSSGAPFVFQPSEEKLKQLEQLGVPRIKAQQLLIETGNNVDMAAALFFSEVQ